jgi:CHAD domain-containing protein
LRPRKSLKANLRRLARKLLVDADARLSKDHRSRDAIVHDLRKLFKRLRALLRLFRAGFGKQVYHEENARLRDLSRPLTEVRDAEVLIETFDNLLDHSKDHLDGNSFTSARELLKSQ